MDECKNCTVRGDLHECMKTPCQHHKSWMVQELKALLAEARGVLESATANEQVDGLRQRMDAVLSEAGGARLEGDGFGACLHGVLWPHECKECADRVSDADIQVWMRREALRRGLGG